MRMSMRLKLVISLAAVLPVFFIAGCANTVRANNDAYLNNDQTIQSIVANDPSGQHQLQSYYSVPVISTAHQTVPSYLPPSLAKA